MARSPVLLLLLLLPGLVLPAGLLLRLCRCERPREPASCCQVAAAEPSCCRHADPAPPAPAPGAPDEAIAPRCGCTWLQLGPDHPEPQRSDAAPVELPSALPTAAATLPEPVAAIDRAPTAWSWCRPPPDHGRTLPLRL